jgi:hypothetical protein
MIGGSEFFLIEKAEFEIGEPSSILLYFSVLVSDFGEPKYGFLYV